MSNTKEKLNLDILEQIILQEERLINAVINSDVAELDALIHDDLIFNLPDGQTATKQMDLNAYRSGNMKVKEIIPFDRIIKPQDNTVTVSVGAEMKGQYFDQPIDGNFRYLRVWKQFEGQWQIIAGSCVQIV